MPLMCEQCKAETKRVVLHEGALWCAPCHEAALGINRATAVHGDDIPGGITVENYGPQPMTFYTWSSMEKYRQRSGLQLKEKFSPLPGTDKDPQGIPNPDGYKDPYTLAAGAALICRNGQRDFDGVESGVLRNLTVETVANADEMRKALGQTKPVDA